MGLSQHQRENPYHNADYTGRNPMKESDKPHFFTAQFEFELLDLKSYQEGLAKIYLWDFQSPKRNPVSTLISFFFSTFKPKLFVWTSLKYAKERQMLSSNSFMGYRKYFVKWWRVDK